jgi:hypothetical protein
MCQLDATLKKNSKWAYYMKMVDCLKAEPGTETEVQLIWRDLGRWRKMEEADDNDGDPAPAGPPEVLQDGDNESASTLFTSYGANLDIL